MFLLYRNKYDMNWSRNKQVIEHFALQIHNLDCRFRNPGGANLAIELRVKVL